ncbi:MAG: Rrf2 family transcriptional regulator [Deltaproteobacteria bacterium]|nr:Rrf2 family transcriptional regulator [Deltaproteobacteria bacterium]
MKLPTQIRYGTRALFYMAFQKGGAYTQTKEIAEKEEIPPRYMEQIFQRFKKAGLVGSMRGPTGGYYLLKRPEEITVGDIVRAIIGSDLELVPCGERKSKRACNRKDNCVARGIWNKASRLVMDYFDSVTLHDMCEKAKSMGLEREIERKLIYHI